MPIEARRSKGIRFVCEAIAELQQRKSENEIDDAENSIQPECKEAERPRWELLLREEPQEGFPERIRRGRAMHGAASRHFLAGFAD